MKVAVTLIGWLAVALLGGWLAWWAVTRADATPHASSTIALGSILLLTWAVGAVLVWRRSWFATVTFAMAAALPLTPEHALPLPNLLVALSAALAVGSWLAGMASWLRSLKRTPGNLDARASVREGQPASLQRCVICQAPTEATICAACADVLGPLSDAWMTGAAPGPRQHPGRRMVAGMTPRGATGRRRHDA
jgi:hypothetical protein